MQKEKGAQTLRQKTDNTNIGDYWSFCFDFLGTFFLYNCPALWAAETQITAHHWNWQSPKVKNSSLVYSRITVLQRFVCNPSLLKTLMAPQIMASIEK